MHLVYNTPRNILHIRCFQFLLGITFAPRKIKDNGFANVIFFLLGVGGGGWEGGGYIITRYIMVYVELVNFLFFSPRISHLDPP